jgi:hypothetical protein
MTAQQPWDFDSRIVTPDGIEIHVEITIPAEVAWRESGPRADANVVANIANEAATTVLRQISDIKNEVPF